MLQYTLEAALGSRHLDRCLFTSDDPEMMDLARSLGVDVPFRRPAHLASDTASSMDVVLHAIDWMKNERSFQPDAIVLLQPTCPFRDSRDIDSAIELFEAAAKESLVSVSAVSQHPCEMVALEGGRLRWAVEPPTRPGRQAFPEYYFITGAIYITTPSFLRNSRNFFDANAAIHVIDRIHGFDIDDPDQLEMARGLIHAIHKVT